MYYVMVHLASGILLLLAFEYTGRMTARVLSLPTERTGLPILFHFALGFAAWAVALMALGSVGLLRPGIIRVGVCVAVLLAGLDLVRRIRSDDPPRIGLFDAERWTGFGLVEFASLAAIIGPLAFYYLLALSPALSWDADNYHLRIPKLFLEHGGFRHVPFSLYATWPFNTEMLYTLAMSFQDYLLAKTLHFAIGVILAVAIFETARRFSTPIAGLVALALFMTERLVRFEISIAYVDLSLALFYFLAYLTWQRASLQGPLTRSLELRLLLITGICAAFFAGSKLTGAVVIAIFIGMQLAVDLARGRDLRTLATNGIVLGLPSIALVLPWYIKAWVLIGDPMHPGLYPIFQGGGVEWSAELAQGAFEYHSSRGMGREPLDYLLLPARLIGMLDLDATGGFGSTDIRGTGYKAWWAGILPILLWGAFRLRSVRQLLVPALIYFVYWSQSSQIARLLLPALPFFCCAAGISIAEAAETLAGRFSGDHGPRPLARLIRAGPGIVTLGVGLMVWWNHPLLSVAQLTNMLSRYSVPQSEIIDRAIHRHFKFINDELPDDARLMMINYSRGFFCNREYIADSLFPASQMAYLMKDVSNVDELLAVFEAHEITHLLYTTLPESPRFPEALYEAMKNEDVLKRVHRSGRIRIFEIRR